MNQSLVRMAKQASSDASLMASFIRRYGEREGLSWEDIAKELRIDSLQLAKLALCRTPRQTSFSDDIAQIVEYAGVNSAVLLRFIQQKEAVPAAVGLGARWRAFTEGIGLMFNRRTWAIGFAALVLLIAGAVAFAQPRRSDATLVVAKGSATVTEAGATVLAFGRSELTVPAGEIASVSAGDKIALGPGSTAQLRLVDGSTVDIFENSTLEVATLFTTEDSYRVGLHMLAGKTVSRVIRLLGAGDAFSVSTPSSTASVRGTIFTVEVVDADTTHIACDEGVVVVAMGSQNAEVVAGTELTAAVGSTLDVEPQVDFEAPEPLNSPPDDESQTQPDTASDPPSNRPIDPPEGRPAVSPEIPPGPPSGRPVGPPGDEAAGSPFNDTTPPGISDHRPDNDDDKFNGEANPHRPTNLMLPRRIRRHASESAEGSAADGLPPGLAKKGDRKGAAPVAGLDESNSKNPHGRPPGQTGENPGQGNSGSPPGQSGENPGQGNSGNPPGQGNSGNPPGKNK